MEKDIVFNITDKNEGYRSFSIEGVDTEFKLQTKADLTTVIDIVETVYNNMMRYMANGIDMYAVKQPLLTYYIMDRLSNIDVSGVLDVTTDENGDEITNLDVNKANQLCTSEFGTIIYRMMLLDIENDEFNSIFQIHQLLNRKIEMFERQVLNTSPTDDVINEVYSLVHEFKEFAEKLSKQADKVDISKIFENLKYMTPKNFVEEYLKSDNRHDMIKNIMNKDDANKNVTKNIRQANKKYNNYKQSRRTKQNRALQPKDADKDIINFVQNKDGE